MGDSSKKDDFWNTSDDSFWSKPVVSDDWLKEDTDLGETLNQATKDNPYASSSWSSTFSESSETRDSFWDENPMDSSGVRQEQDSDEEDFYVYEGESGNDNPYTYVEETQPASTYHEEKQPAAKYQSAEAVYKQITGDHGNSIKNRKLGKLSKRKKICIIFAGLTVLCAIFFVGLMIADKSKATNAVRNSKVEIVEVGSKFHVFSNNEVSLESSAFLVEKAAHAEGFPDDTMLVAVRCEITSDDYIRDTMIKSPYLGFEYEGENLYLKASSMYSVNDYLVDTKYYNEVLSPYGEGNGISSSGYYCFMVPKGAENPYIYFEETKNVNHIDIVTRTYVKKLDFNRFSKEHPESKEGEE